MNQLSSNAELTTAIDQALSLCMLQCGYPELTVAEHTRPGVQLYMGGEPGVIPLGATLCQEPNEPCPKPKGECERYECQSPIFSPEHSYCHSFSEHENGACHLEPPQSGIGACKSGACVSQADWPRECGGAVARYLGTIGWSYAFSQLDCPVGKAPADCERDAHSLLALLLEHVHQDLIQCLLRVPSRTWGGSPRVRWGDWPTEKKKQP